MASVAEVYAGIKLTPAMRTAAVAYASGIVRTKKEAAKLANCTPVHFINMTNHNEELRRIIGDTQTMIEDESISTSQIVQKLGRRALGRLAELMDSANEGVAFRAAQDLADRAPETQKTQKVQLDALTLSGQDAKALAAAMIESARESARFEHVAKDGLVEIDTDRRDEVRTLKLIPGGASEEEGKGQG